jgi:gamma-glutamyl phosphate reductase
MIRKLVLAAALGAMAFPACAGPQVTINVAGLESKSVHVAILRAAQAACREALADETTLVQFYVRPECLDQAIAQAEAKYAMMHGLASR